MVAPAFGAIWLCLQAAGLASAVPLAGADRHKIVSNPAPARARFLQSVKRTRFVVGGDLANDTKAGTVAIGVLYKGQLRHTCGGTLVDDRFIVTAAHCIVGQEIAALRVIAGHINISEATQDEWLPLTTAVAHEQFDEETLLNDVAVLRLAQPSKATSLPLIPEDASLKPKQQVTVFGWGQMDADAEPNGDEPVLPGGGALLRTVSLNVMDNAECNLALLALRDSFSVYPSMICAATGPAGGHGSCFGDSGGPLVAEVNGKRYLTGIVSWGDGGCGDPNSADVYTRVASHLGWIRGKMLQLAVRAPYAVNGSEAPLLVLSGDDTDDFNGAYVFVGVNRRTILPVTLTNPGSLAMTVAAYGAEGDLENFTLDHGDRKELNFTVSSEEEGPIFGIALDVYYTASDMLADPQSASVWYISEVLPPTNFSSDWYTTPGRSAWQLQDDGSMVSGKMRNGNASCLLTYLPGPGDLSFEWMVSSEEGWDTVTVFVDGFNVTAMSGERGWRPLTLRLSGEYEHTVAWHYEKDESYSRGSDLAGVRKVAFTQAGTSSTPRSGLRGGSRF